MKSYISSSLNQAYVYFKQICLIPEFREREKNLYCLLLFARRDFLIHICVQKEKKDYLFLIFFDC